MKINTGIPKGKRLGGSLRGKCFVCGLDTKLNVHSKCGTISEPKKAAPMKDTERECINLDCLKIFKPTSRGQKFCHECSVDRKERQTARWTTQLCNNY